MAEAGNSTNLYKNGWNAYQSGQFIEAARIWQELAHNSEITNNQEQPQAAFAALLATISWEKAGNNQAYSSWADAIRLYLEAGTQWEQQRELLKLRIADNRAALRHLNSDAPIVINPLDQLLLMVDDDVKLADYNGPRTGLQASLTDDKTEDVRGFFSEAANDQVQVRSEDIKPPEVKGGDTSTTVTIVEEKSAVIEPAVTEENQNTDIIQVTRHIIPVDDVEVPTPIVESQPVNDQSNLTVTPVENNTTEDVTTSTQITVTTTVTKSKKTKKPIKKSILRPQLRKVP